MPAKKSPPLPPIPSPPDGLSERALALWYSVVPSRARSAGRVAVITEALRSLDLADAARLAVVQDGLISTTSTTGAMHAHPAAKLERENRAAFSRLWAELGFDFDQDVDPVRDPWS